MRIKGLRKPERPGATGLWSALNTFLCSCRNHRPLSSLQHFQLGAPSPSFAVQPERSRNFPQAGEASLSQDGRRSKGFFSVGSEAAEPAQRSGRETSEPEAGAGLDAGQNSRYLVELLLEILRVAALCRELFGEV